jgi:hypothetical protein
MAATGETPRLELALTPAHVDALRHHIRSQRQWFLGTIAFATTTAAMMPLLPIPGQAPSVWNVLMAVAFTVGVAVVADWLFWRMPLTDAIGEGVYYRKSGPIRTFTTPKRGTHVTVGDVRINYVPDKIGTQLRDLPWGTLDYVPRVRIAIELRDADGELLYRYPGYRPDADRFDVRPMPSILVGILCGIGTCTVVMLCMFALVVWIDSHR